MSTDQSTPMPMAPGSSVWPLWYYQQYRSRFSDYHKRNGEFAPNHADVLRLTFGSSMLQLVDGTQSQPDSLPDQRARAEAESRIAQPSNRANEPRGTIAASTRPSKSTNVTSSSSSKESSSGSETIETYGSVREIVDAYSRLVALKIRLCRSGNAEESNEIQAAINVAIVLRWTKLDVLQTLDGLKRLENRIQRARGTSRVHPGNEGNADADSLKPTAMMAEVMAEKKTIIWFAFPPSRTAEDPNLQKEWEMRSNSWNWFRELKYRHGPQNMSAESTDHGRDFVVSNDMHAPYHLIKIQAALNVAFMRFLGQPETTAYIDEPLSHDLDTSYFEGKAMRLLRLADKECAREIEYHIKHSKVGRRWFGDEVPDPSGSLNGSQGPLCTIEAFPGIERPMTETERQSIMVEMQSCAPEVFETVSSIAALLMPEVIVKDDNNRGGNADVDADGDEDLEMEGSDVEAGTPNQPELSDQGCGMLDYFCRVKGNRVLWPDVVHVAEVLDDEDEDI